MDCRKKMYEDKKKKKKSWTYYAQWPMFSSKYVS